MRAVGPRERLGRGEPRGQEADEQAGAYDYPEEDEAIPPPLFDFVLVLELLHNVPILQARGLSLSPAADAPHRFLGDSF